MTEEVRDNDLRILAFKKPDGKLTVVLSNRSGSPHIFHVSTGLQNATFKGFRYTPTDAGENCQGRADRSAAARRDHLAASGGSHLGILGAAVSFPCRC